MAAIVNDRDVLLQAALVRLETVTLPNNIIVPAIKAIKLTVPSYTFQVSTLAVASPASILLTASLVQITGAITFGVIAGTGTLTGVTGTTATLSYANMTSDSITIRAQVIESGITYNADVTIAKVRDGNRGSLTGYSSSVSPAIYMAGTSWSSPTDDNNASKIIWQMLGNAGTPPSSAHLRLGDTVTLTNGASPTAAATRFWDGVSAWLVPGTVINGNLLVNGTVAAAALSVTSLSAITANLGTVTAGNITGTANLTVAGKAQFTGNFAGTSGFNTANEVNYGGAASFGVMGFSGAAGIGGGVGVYGQVTIGAPSSSAGVQGTSSGTAGVGVQGIADATGVGVHAMGDSSGGTGIGLKIVGKLQWGLAGNLGSFLTWAKPANSGTKVLCDDGSWINLAAAVVYVSSGAPPATSVLGSIVVDTLSPIGQIRLPYYAP